MSVSGNLWRVYKSKVWNCGDVECGRVDPWNKESSTNELEHESRNSEQYIVEHETLSMNNEDGMWSTIVPRPKGTPMKKHGPSSSIGPPTWTSMRHQKQRLRDPPGSKHLRP